MLGGFLPKWFATAQRRLALSSERDANRRVQGRCRDEGWGGRDSRRRERTLKRPAETTLWRPTNRHALSRPTELSRCSRGCGSCYSSAGCCRADQDHLKLGVAGCCGRTHRPRGARRIGRGGTRHDPPARDGRAQSLPYASRGAGRAMAQRAGGEVRAGEALMVPWSWSTSRARHPAPARKTAEGPPRRPTRCP